MTADGLHPVIAAASRGELPAWARMGEERRAHTSRVAALLAAWSDELGMAREDRARWVAAGWLHDCLKDGDAEELRGLVAAGLDELPERILHGPAAAARLAMDGVDDRELLDAVAWHTLGHPRLGRMGMAVYCADFLEPGRDLHNSWREDLRDRMPDGLRDVTRDILRARIEHLLSETRPVRPETMGFWNRLAGGEAWARASEV